MAYDVLSTSSVLPLSLDEVKSYLRIGSDSDDTALNLHLKSAIDSFEKQNFIAASSKKISQTFDFLHVSKALALSKITGCGAFLRPIFGPVISIESVSLRDINGVFQIASLSLISLEHNKFIIKGAFDEIQIIYNCGFADGALPSFYKIKILEEISKAINRRDDGNDKDEIGARL